MTERWKDIAGYEDVYQASSLGRMKRMSGRTNTYRGRILKPTEDARGYLHVTLWKDGVNRNAWVHRLVAESFLPRSPGKNEVNHKNGNKSDNRVENLEWCTRSENNRHAFSVLGRSGISLRGEANGRSILTDRKVVEIRRLYDTGEHTQRELGEMFGVSNQAISAIIRRETWQHVP